MSHALDKKNTDKVSCVCETNISINIYIYVHVSRYAWKICKDVRFSPKKTTGLDGMTPSIFKQFGWQVS